MQDRLHEGKGSAPVEEGASRRLGMQEGSRGDIEGEARVRNHGSGPFSATRQGRVSTTSHGDAKARVWERYSGTLLELAGELAGIEEEEQDAAQGTVSGGRDGYSWWDAAVDKKDRLFIPLSRFKEADS